MAKELKFTQNNVHITPSSAVKKSLIYILDIILVSFLFFDSHLNLIANLVNNSTNINFIKEVILYNQTEFLIIQIHLTLILFLYFLASEALIGKSFSEMLLNVETLKTNGHITNTNTLLIEKKYSELFFRSLIKSLIFIFPLVPIIDYAFSFFSSSKQTLSQLLTKSNNFEIKKNINNAML